MFDKFRKFEEVKDGQAGGAPNVVVPAPTPIPTPAPDAAKPAASETPGEKSYDAYGYLEQKKPGEETPPAQKKDITPPKEEKLEDIKDPGTGYGIKEIPEPVVEAVPPAAPIAKDPNAPPEPPPVELDLKGFDEKSAKIMTEFVKEKNIPKEHAQAFADLVKAQTAENLKAQAEQLRLQKIETEKEKVKWDRELRNDPAFGGEKFAKSLHMTEKVLRDFLPNTKKELTARGTMLPPYVMRDLAALGEKLYATEKFVQGDPPEAPKEEKKIDPLAFYT